MASSLAFPCLQLNFQSPTNSASTRRFVLRPICASVSEKSSSSSSSSQSSVSAQPAADLPIKKIPGDYGLPFVGPIKDRQDYFYNQGREEFFKSRIQKYQSTVFRVNMPPGPLITNKSQVVALLDGKSFQVLFDVSKVEKKDVFTGTYMPSLDLTGGYRILSYLDPSEPKHDKLKRVMFFLLKSGIKSVIPEFHSSYSQFFETLESKLADKGKANFNEANDQAAFNFLARALYGANPADTQLGTDGPKLVQKWVLFQLSPILLLGLPKFIEDPLFHSFRLPPFLVKKDYQRLYDFFYHSSAHVLDEAERLGVSRDEACHNLLFATCFNSFGGMKLFFPNMIKWLGRAGAKLHNQLAQEIRSAVRTNGGNITMSALEQMPLMKSVVYEAFRIDPPVPLQTPKIFEKAAEFVPDRFVGEQGEKLLQHVLWSNGPETENPTVGNKQCAGKDFVMLASRLLVVEFFLRYDSFEIEVATSPLGPAITMTSLKRASF
ncbi:hypothetical protein M0R45_012580 [Rubus argutus]|uniref:Allene oxide synthase n=1 Tax=Rubus argutus TaxID=59490 RepID=A0AAW1YD40_RUBAR